MNNQSEITLSHNDKTITDKSEVANIFNNYYVNIATDFGPSGSIDSSECTDDMITCINERYENHTSIHNIKNHMFSVKGNFNSDFICDFRFKHVNPDIVKKHLSKLNVRKATGYDNLSPKILKLGAPVLASPICSISV